MRKRRSIVYVRPGKDVTLYVPAETPPQVIDYLNQLKEDGTFSQGVMEMITQYVMQQGVEPNAVRWAQAVLTEPPGESDDNDHLSRRIHTEPAFSHFEEEDGDEVPSFESHSPFASSQDRTDTAHQKLDLTQIFRQAQRNAGKMNLDSNR